MSEEILNIVVYVFGVFQGVYIGWHIRRIIKES